VRHYSPHEFRGAERDGLVKQPSSNHDVGAKLFTAQSTDTDSRRTLFNYFDVD